MRASRLGLACTLVLCLLVSIPHAIVRAAEPGTGVISGKIVNRTQGGGTVAQQTVTLLASRSSAGFERADTTSSDGSGGFTFSGLETTNEMRYRIVVEFQGVSYYADDVVLSDTDFSKSVEVVVYDATTDKSVIRIESGHLIAFVEGDSIRVQEAYVMVNSGDKTYTGPGAAGQGHPGTLVTSVPPGAIDVEPGDGLQSFRLGSGETIMLYLYPVLPGKSQLLYAYRVAFRDGESQLTTRLYYPTDGYRLLVQENGARVTAPQLQGQEPLDMGGTRFSYYLGKALSQDTVLMITITMMGGAVGGPSPLIWVLIAVGFVALALAVTITLSKRSKQVAIAGDERQDRLIRRIAELDDSFGTGRIEEDEYRRERDLVKQELKELMEGTDGPTHGRR